MGFICLIFCWFCSFSVFRLTGCFKVLNCILIYWKSKIYSHWATSLILRFPLLCWGLPLMWIKLGQLFSRLSLQWNKGKLLYLDGSYQSSRWGFAGLVWRSWVMIYYETTLCLSYIFIFIFIFSPHKIIMSVTMMTGFGVFEREIRTVDTPIAFTKALLVGN